MAMQRLTSQEEYQARKEFEKWLSKQPTQFNKRFERDIVGDYFSPTVDLVWQCWKFKTEQSKVSH